MTKAEHPAVEHLRHHRRQLDADGIQVGVSRQALDETLARLAALETRNDDLRQFAEDAAKATLNTLAVSRRWCEVAQQCAGALEQVLAIGDETPPQASVAVFDFAEAALARFKQESGQNA